MHRFRQLLSRLAALPADLERGSFPFAVFMTALKSFGEDHCTHLAAAIAYYGVFSLFPLLLGLIALASLLFQSPAVQSEIVAAVGKSIPSSGALVQSNIERVLAVRGTIGIVAALMLLWSAQGIFAAITTSLNLAWNVPERRSWFMLTGMQLALVLGTGFFLAISMALTSAVALLDQVDLIDLPVAGPLLAALPLLTILTEIVSIALNGTAFALIYRFLPNKVLAFGDIWHGALIAAILFEIAKFGYVIYSTSFANYRLVYGSLAAFIVLLFWAWISGVILLFGAEITVAINRLSAERQ